MTLRRALLLVLTLAACRDPSAGPPPRRLDAAQRARIEPFVLDAAPEPAHVPPGGPVTLGNGRVRYLGFDVVPDPAVRGGRAALTHYWEAVEPLKEDQKVFVHLSPPGRKGVLVNGDHVPVLGLLPPIRWEAGRVYADRHEVDVPADAPGEALEVYVGMYRFDDRLRVDRRAAHDGRNRIRAGRIALTGERPPLPEYRAPRTEAPPKLDGRLDDPIWQKAPVARLSRSNGRGAPTHHTRARLAWDDTRLYVAFDAEDPDVWSTFQKDDDPLYEQEVVEIFLDADGNGRTYDELQVAPTGRIFDASFVAPRRGMNLGWSSGMQAAVHVRGTLGDDSDTDQGWTAEIAIPYEGLSAVPRVPPRPGDVWRFNLYRLEKPGRRGTEGSALSPPVVPDFHRPERFARLIFTADAPVSDTSGPGDADRP